ncbi:hypothetical protein [Persicirhabdus sediminis]|uniref:Uncharacterized protein n=1 Tax=Persicirhabdus sediminis TaxID=454144 RepID=A0A8J7MEU3_9BACT|nr:hypothetical protein [Persicirhabdus sediminis]MBK1792077.1 hypothetical protein [Persicirhabdus sediminis]
MLRTLLDQLYDFHQNHEEVTTGSRESLIEAESKEVRAFAAQEKLLNAQDCIFADLEFDHIGAENGIILSPRDNLQSESLVHKITNPADGFGLIPKVSHASEPDQIELIPATLMEYIQRWLLCEEVFQDSI